MSDIDEQALREAAEAQNAPDMPWFDRWCYLEGITAREVLLHLLNTIAIQRIKLTGCARELEAADKADAKRIAKVKLAVLDEHDALADELSSELRATNRLRAKYSKEAEGG